MYYFAFSGVRDKESNHHHFLKFEYNYTLFSFYFLVSLLKHLPIWSPYGEIYQSKCFLHSLVTISICFKSPSDTIRRDKKNSFWRSHSFRWFRTFDVIREFPVTTTLLSSLTVQILCSEQITISIWSKTICAYIVLHFWVQIFKHSPCHIIFIKTNRIDIKRLHTRLRNMANSWHLKLSWALCFLSITY